MTKSQLKRAVNDPALAWTRPRATRRLLVLANVALFLSITAAFWWALQSEPSWRLALGIVLLLPWMFLTGALNASVRGLTELRQRDLDEWEQRTRDGIYRQLYLPAITIGGAIAAVLMFADWPLADKAVLFFAGWFTMIGLPVFVLAWRLPDEPDDA